MTKSPPKSRAEGYIFCNGLISEVRVIRTHSADKEMVLVETALGEHWVRESEIFFFSVVEGEFVERRDDE